MKQRSLIKADLTDCFDNIPKHVDEIKEMWIIVTFLHACIFEFAHTVIMIFERFSQLVYFLLSVITLPFILTSTDKFIQTKKKPYGLLSLNLF